MCEVKNKKCRSDTKNLSMWTKTDLAEDKEVRLKHHFVSCEFVIDLSPVPPSICVDFCVLEKETERQS